MKIANIIIAHKNPNQLLRLVNQYDEKLFHNFIHIDGRCNIKEYVNVINQPHVTLLPKRRKIVWSGYSFVKVVLEAFQYVKNKEGRYLYYNVMSGMDFPIQSSTEFYAFLKSAYTTTKNEFFEISDLETWPGKHRYERFHLTNWTIKGRYFTERIINWFIPKRKFWGGLTPYGRSAWFTATDKFVEHALHFVKDNPGYIRFLNTVWNPDEFAFNVMVMNSSFKDRVAGHNLRHIDWSEKKVHPKLFRNTDLDALLKSGKFLARKFDESVDKEIIDSLEMVLSNKSETVSK